MGKSPIGGMLLLFAAGCASTPPPLSGREVLAVLANTLDASAEKVAPSLVYVEVRGGLPQPPAIPGRGQPSVPQQMGVTGMILSADGVVLLPLPVKAEGVERIRVWVGTSEYGATVLDVDEQAGLTLVKISSPAPLVPVQFASSKICRGAWVTTVTAMGERAEFQKLVDVGTIQGTLKGEFDRLILGSGAATSATQWLLGTAVVNLDGQVVGIGKGPGGIFAAEDYKPRVDRLLAKATQVSEGPAIGSDNKKPWLGVRFDTVNESLAEALGIPKEAVWVQAVYRDSPAQKAGLKPGDLVVGVDDKPITEKGNQAAPYLMKLLAPETGRTVTLKLLRGAAPVEAPITFVRQPEVRTLKAEDLGLSVEEIADERYYQAGLSRPEGVLVTQVIPGSPAATSGSMRSSLLRSGDIIVELNGLAIRTLDDFSGAVESIRRQKQETPLVKLYRGVVATHVALNMKLKKIASNPEGSK